MSCVSLAVGTTNPAKINAALAGSQKALKKDEIIVFGYDVSSGIPSQPIGDEETLKGAINRAKGAFDAHVRQHNAAPDFAVGLEGGVAESALCPSDLECFAWIVVYDGKKLSRSRTGSFILPPPITQLILGEGLELGEADDRFFGTTDSKRKGGSVGQLTGGVIDRAAYYEHAVVLAFVPFHWDTLYDGMGGATDELPLMDAQNKRST
ncbi:inosine/xanthosine triphosphatase [archaeon]|nr:MAG: inosine/xanthosine triphosphatase [archaeon]